MSAKRLRRKAAGTKGLAERAASTSVSAAKGAAATKPAGKRTARGRKRGAEQDDHAPYLGPITNAALERQKQGPPPMIAEWHEAMKGAGDYVLLWAGAVRLGEGRGDRSWSCLWVNTGYPPPDEKGEPKRKSATDADAAAKVECLLTPLAHEARVRLMQALYDGPRGASELTAATDLRGGNLYHHLKELIHADCVCEQDGGYALTNTGRYLLITMEGLAGQFIEDRDEEGLVGKTW